MLPYTSAIVPPSPRRFWSLVTALVLAAGFAWRLTIAARGTGAAAPCADPQEEYFLTSVLLRSNHIYGFDPGGEPGARRSPLYPTFLMLAQSASAHPSPRSVFMAQAFLGLFAAAMGWSLGLRLHSPAAGAAAAAGLALSPALAASVTTLNVHAFYGAVILALGAVVAEWAERDGSRAAGAAMGMMLGISLLCRTAHIALIPLLAIAAIVWWGLPGLKRIAWAFLVAGVMLIPWTIRNFVHTGNLMPLDAGIGNYNLLAAANDIDHAATVELAYRLAEQAEPGFTSLHSADAPYARERALGAVARRLILRHPAKFLSGCLRRLIAFWRPMAISLVLALFGSLAPANGRGVRAAALVAASFVLYCAMGLGTDYRLEVQPLLTALAGIGLATLLRRRRAPLKDGAWRGSVPALAVIGVSAAICFIMTPIDSFAALDRNKPRCESPSPFLLAFLDDGIRTCGPGWSHAHWAGTLRARPEVCAGMDAFAAGAPAEAARRFGAAAALAPRDPEIRLSLAVALGASGQKARARRECDEAGRLIPPGPSAPLDELRTAVRATRDSLSNN